MRQPKALSFHQRGVLVACAQPHALSFARAQIVRGYVEQEVQRERCKTNVLQPWDNRGVYCAS